MSVTVKKRFFVLTGPPGVGKTTIVKNLAQEFLRNDEIKVQGFYTEELRENGVRTGFDIVTLDNKRTSLARVASSVKGPSVGKYTVEVNSVDTISSSLLDVTDSKTLLVIDEIGKMEMFSNVFKRKVSDSIARKQFILATIPIEKGAPVPLLTAVRSSPHTQLFTVTRTNRDYLLEEISTFIQKAMKDDSRYLGV